MRGLVLKVCVGAVLTLAVGCDGDTPTDAPDGGRWMPTDSGIPPRPDAEATSGRDAGADRVCIPLMPLAAEALPRCHAATRDCVTSCPEGMDGDGCRSSCWSSDDMPALDPSASNPFDCDNCIFTQLLACLDRDTCHAEVAAFLCCLVDCGGDAACQESECMDAQQSMFLCGAYQAPQCFDVVGGDVGMCYAAEDPVTGTDGGVTDADAGATEVDAAVPVLDGGAS